LQPASFADRAAVNIPQYIFPAVITVMAVRYFIWEFLVIKLKECFSSCYNCNGSPVLYMGIFGDKIKRMISQAIHL